MRGYIRYQGYTTSDESIGGTQQVRGVRMGTQQVRGVSGYTTNERVLGVHSK